MPAEALGFVFPSELGWMALEVNDRGVSRLSFGHASPRAAAGALGVSIPQSTIPTRWKRLVARLQAYAAGKPDDFLDVPVDTSHLTPFSQVVVERCRHIRPGQRMSYGRLAEAAGKPRAARVVGSVMAKNRVALIVPCHRIVGCNGGLGGYSMSAGLKTKQRLLDQESSAIGRKKLPQKSA